jgi:hypothetical protein
MKKFLAITTLALASLTAQAGVVTGAGGVSWLQKPTAPNFETSIDYTQWWTTNNTTGIADVGVGVDTSSINPTIANFVANLADVPELVGAGHFDLGVGVGEPNCTNCELTFNFGGFFLEGFDQVGTGTFRPDGSGGFEEILATVPSINTDNAWLNLYLGDTAAQFDESLIIDAGSASTQVANAVDGDLWLSLSLHNFVYTADILAGTEPLSLGSSTFFGSVEGGSSAANFESDFFLGLFDASAFGLTSSFIVPNSSDIVNYSTRGSGNVQAETVSEPTTLAVFGLALLGFAGAARRKQSK